MRFRSSLFLIASVAAAHAEERDAATLFTQNCAPCHQLDQEIVGPSLAEMRDLYAGKPADFVKWSIAPEKKRPHAIAMPSMAHLDEESLRAIHAHIMEISEGVAVKKASNADSFAASPTQAARPLVQRIFMPDAGPASIAVALNDRISFCWDAGPCRLRYVWTDGFIDGFPYWRGNGSSQARVLGKIRYTEPELAPGGDPPRFQGYELDAEGYPTFVYRLGETSVRESYRPVDGQAGFERRVRLEPTPSSPLVLKFPGAPAETGIHASAGQWSGDTLILSPAEAGDFTLIHVFP